MVTKGVIRITIRAILRVGIAAVEVGMAIVITETVIARIVVTAYPTAKACLTKEATAMGNRLETRVGWGISCIVVVVDQNQAMAATFGTTD